MQPEGDFLTEPLDGYHLTIDGAVESDVLRSTVSQFLVDVVRQIDMTPLGPTQIETPDEATLIGIQMIAESHITIHVYWHRVYIDVFSCKPFGLGAVVQLTHDLMPGVWMSRIRKRGTPNEEPKESG